MHRLRHPGRPVRQLVDRPRNLRAAWARWVRRLAHRRCDFAEDGAYATAELVAGIALLLLPVTLVVLTLPVWAERRSLATSAAHDAALALARSSSWPAGKARAEQIVEEMARNYGLRGNEPVRLMWEPDRGGATVERGEKVTAVVSVATPGVFVPGLGYIGRWELTARHTETVDRYRSL